MGKPRSPHSRHGGAGARFRRHAYSDRKDNESLWNNPKHVSTHLREAAEKVKAEEWEAGRAVREAARAAKEQAREAAYNKREGITGRILVWVTRDPYR